MPELAEVELVRRQLDGYVGSEITTVTTDGNPRFAPARAAVGVLVATSRAGKTLAMSLRSRDGSANWVHIHLGMTGQLLGPAAQPPERWRVHWDMNGEGSMYLADVRGFGRVAVSGSAPTTSAPEPFDAGFSDHLTKKLERPGATMFDRLLDQKTAPGVGAYVAQESLWRSGVSPSARQLDGNGSRLLASAVRDVVDEALEHGGMTMRDYRHLDGSKGAMFERLACYGRHGRPCLRCDTTLERVKIGVRGVSFCPSCQQ